MGSRWGAVDGHEITKRIKETHQLFGIFQISGSKNTKSLERTVFNFLSASYFRAIVKMFPVSVNVTKIMKSIGEEAVHQRIILNHRREGESEGDQKLFLPSFQPQLG